MRKIDFSCLFTSAIVLLAAVAQAADIAPPPYNLTDRNQVNVASGHVAPSLVDLSIGGAMGLQHQISSHSSQFVNYDRLDGAFGFVDNYRGGLYTALHSTNTESRCKDVYDDITCTYYVFRAFGGGYSQDFDISTTSPGTYTPLNDVRYSLALVPGRGYVMTAPDGTEIVYGAPNISTPMSDPFNYPRIPMREIVKPNGLITNVYRMNTPGNDTLPPATMKPVLPVMNMTKWVTALAKLRPAPTS